MKKKQKIGNYHAGTFISEWLARELNDFDFNQSVGNIKCEEVFTLRVVASYENYIRNGGTYIDFRNRLINKKGGKNG